MSNSSFLDAKLDPVTCASCGHSFQGVAKKSFLGFKSYTCDLCGKKTNYPLHNGFRIFYWIFLISALVVKLFVFPQMVPSIFIIMMAFAVITDIAFLWKRRKPGTTTLGAVMSNLVFDTDCKHAGQRDVECQQWTLQSFP